MNFKCMTKSIKKKMDMDKWVTQIKIDKIFME